MDQDKRRQRQLKREVKKAGNRKLRNHLKRQLAESPEDAAHHADDFDYGANSSETLNGMDQDATRKREDEADSAEADE